MYKNDSQLNSYVELKSPSIHAFYIAFRLSSVGWMDYGLFITLYYYGQIY